MAAQTGTRPEKIRIQKWYTIYKVRWQCLLPLPDSSKQRLLYHSMFPLCADAYTHRRIISLSLTTRFMMAWA